MLISFTRFSETASQFTLKPSQNQETTVNSKRVTSDLINTLLATEGKSSATVAQDLQTTLDNRSALYLHLRDAELSITDAVTIANALKKHSLQTD